LKWKLICIDFDIYFLWVGEMNSTVCSYKIWRFRRRKLFATNDQDTKHKANEPVFLPNACACCTTYQK